MENSDLDRFVELYKSFGIDLPVEKVNNSEIFGYSVELGEDIDNKFSGYSGFYSIVLFDKNGNFVQQQFYE